MRNALVLNATYEPLSIVSARRAVCLVLSDKADMIEAGTDEVRAERFSMKAPLVIRLRYVVKVPYQRRTAMSRHAIFARDSHRCQYCGARADSIDHVMPRSRGGLHVWENVTAACRPCNLKKRDRTPEEAGMKLETRPFAPRELGWIFLTVPRVPDEWMPYLAQAS
jgi:5-methylcytosine-specific restriction endonuclease McrA